jgi:hypothetical protein
MDDCCAAQQPASLLGRAGSKPGCELCAQVALSAESDMLVSATTHLHDEVLKGGPELRCGVGQQAAGHVGVRTTQELVTATNQARAKGQGFVRPIE